MLARAVLMLLPLVPAVAAAQSTPGEWIHAGDVLAAGADPVSLQGALEAYAHVAPSDPEYVVALQHQAWVEFLLDRPADAIPSYAALVDRLPPSPARDEALVMLAAMFADLDWDRDGAPDADTPLERLADPRLVPQDRAWLAALTYATAHALHVSSHDPEAIALTAHALERWPAPTAATSLGAACRRHRMRPAALHAEGPDQRAQTDAVCARFDL